MAKLNNNYRKNIKDFWKFVNGWIKSSVKNSFETLTDSSGNSFSSYGGRVKILKSHYEKLGSELVMKSFLDSWNSDSNGILDQPITLAEVNYVVKAIKNNKCAGSDGIVGELLKYGGNLLCEMLLTLFNLVWNNEYFPTKWREGLIVSLFN